MTMATLIDSDLASMVITYSNRSQIDYILLNEITYSGYDGTEYQPALEYVLDALHVKYQNALIYVAMPWKRSCGGDCTDWKTRIGNVVAARSAWARLGHDENIWLEGGDDGATMTTDGVHYSAAGVIECANQWKTVLGF